MSDKTVHQDQLPVYNIKAVSRLVGLLPVTLRAWERRYGLPSPHRGDQGYRLYSEHDLNILRWLKNQIDSGMSIGRAVDYLHELYHSGQDPVALFDTISSTAGVHLNAEESPSPFPSPLSLNGELLRCLMEFDEIGASEVMRRAFALYSVDQVLMEVTTPALIRIGELWHEGTMPIATEHFASQFCMQHLMSMIAGSATPTQPGSIVAACAPGETHQIGMLMLVVMLRWRGWDVKYLGPDLKLDGLGEALAPLHPTAIMFTATRVESAERLAGLADILEHFSEPKPLILLGGSAFSGMRLPESVPAIYIQLSPVETVKSIEHLLIQQTRSRRDPKEKDHV